MDDEKRGVSVGWMTQREVMDYFRFKRTTFWRLSRKGVIPPPTMFGTAKRWRVEDVKSWQSPQYAKRTKKNDNALRASSLGQS